MITQTIDPSHYFFNIKLEYHFQERDLYDTSHVVILQTPFSIWETG